jgi:hypothetical protein
MKSKQARAAAMSKALGVVTLALSCVSCCFGGGLAASAYPPSPVPVQASNCHYYQVYEATSPTGKYDSQCGYVVRFSELLGDMKHPADGYLLQADWGDVPPTEADCASSHTVGMAWGYHCDNADCTQGHWVQIGEWQTRAGYWNSVSNKCYLSLGFGGGDMDYKTVQVQVRAYRGSVQMRAKGYIYVYRNTGQCPSAPADTGRH